MKRFALATAGCALLGAAPALACGVDPPFAIVHSALPTPLPTGAIIADVEFETGDPRAYRQTVRARVRRMIQGPDTPILLLEPVRTNSCDAPFRNGRSGLIVAVLVDSRDGVPVARPIVVDMRDGFRLPDGYQLSPPPAPSS